MRASPTHLDKNASVSDKVLVCVKVACYGSQEHFQFSFSFALIWKKFPSMSWLFKRLRMDVVISTRSGLWIGNRSLVFFFDKNKRLRPKGKGQYYLDFKWNENRQRENEIWHYMLTSMVVIKLCSVIRHDNNNLQPFMVLYMLSMQNHMMSRPLVFLIVIIFFFC